MHSDAPLIHHQARLVTHAAPAADQDNIDPLTGTIMNYSNRSAPLVGREPDAMVELAPKENVSFSAAPGTGTDHASYLKTRLQPVTAGVRLPFMSLSGD